MFCVSFAHAERLWILAGRVSIDEDCVLDVKLLNELVDISVYCVTS